MANAVQELHGRIVANRQKLAGIFSKKNDRDEYDWTATDRDDIKSIERALEVDCPKLEQLRADSQREATNKAQLDAMKTVGNELPFSDSRGGDRETQKAKTLSDLFLGSDAYKSWPKESAQLMFARNLKFDMADGFKAVISETVAGGGFAPANNRTDVVILSAQRKPRVADLIPSGTTENQIVKYMTEQTYTNGAASTAEGPTDPDLVRGLCPGQPDRGIDRDLHRGHQPAARRRRRDAGPHRRVRLTLMIAADRGE